MNKNNILVTALVALVVSAGVGFLFHKEAAHQSNTAGLSQRETKTVTLEAGNNGKFTVSNSGALTEGGDVRATSTVQTSATLLATDIDNENIVDFTFNGAVAGGTVTLPASSTLTTFIPKVGQVRTLYIRNATTTAATNITIAGGSGTLLKVASSTNGGAAVITGDTDAGNFARLNFIRKANTDIEVLMTIFKD